LVIADVPGAAHRIDIVAHNHERMTAEFHDGRLHMGTGHGGQLAEYEVQYATRQTGIGECLDELHGTGRRFL
jgi:hypothetical protein